MKHYPRYPGDYLKKTLGLSMVQDGAYSRLLDQYYADEKPLPLDRNELHLLARCADDTDRAAVDHVLPKYFEQTADGWVHERAEEEIEKFHDKSTKAATSASIRWANRKAKAMRTHNERSTDAERRQCGLDANQNHNHNHTTTKEPSVPVGLTPDEGKINGKHLKTKDMNAAAVRLLEFLNSKTGAKYQPVAANILMITARLKEGFTEKIVQQVIANRVSAWQADPKMEQFLRPKTLFAASNFASYSGLIGKTEPPA